MLHNTKCLSMCHFLLGHLPSSWQSVNKKKKKKKYWKRFKTALLKNTFHQPPDIISTRASDPLSPFSLKKGNSFFLNCYYSLKSKIFNDVSYTSDRMMNIYDNQTTAYNCWLVNIKTWHLPITSIPWALQTQWRTGVKSASQEVKGISNALL